MDLLVDCLFCEEVFLKSQVHKSSAIVGFKFKGQLYDGFCNICECFRLYRSFENVYKNIKDILIYTVGELSI